MQKLTFSPGLISIYLTGAKDDGCNLGAVAPFCQEGHDKRLREDGREHNAAHNTTA